MTWKPGPGGTSLVLLLVLYLALRLFALTADPPAGLVSHYQDFAFSVFDEGWWTANAREAVLHGHVRGTGFDLFWVSPFFTGLVTAAFTLGGVSLASARMLSIAMGLVVVVGLWWAGRTGPGREGRADDDVVRAGRWAALLWVVSFVPAQLGRLAVPETSGMALGVAGAVALLTGTNPGRFAAGLLAVLAMLVKPHFGLLVPSFLAASLVLAIRHGRPVVPALVLPILGAAVPLAAWGAYVAAHSAEAAGLASFYLTDRWFAGAPPGLGSLAFVKPAAQVAIAGVVYRHHFLLYLPGVFLLAALAAPRAWSAVAEPRRSASAVPDAVIVFGLWALVGGALLATLPFQPLRYYRPLVPALVFLAAWALTARGAAEAGAGRRERLAVVLRWVLGTFALVQLLFAALAAWLPADLVARTSTRVQLLNPVEFHLAPFLVSLVKAGSLAPFAELPREIAEVAALALCGAVALGVGGLVALVLARPLVRGVRALETVVPRRAAGVLLALMIAGQAFHWMRWLPERAYTLPAMARELERIVPPDEVISPAGTYSLDARREFDSSAVREGAMFDPTGGADWFVALAGHPWIGVLPEGEIERRWPGSEHVATFDLTGGYVYHLYRAGLPRGR
jgi:hypothetical protein